MQRGKYDEFAALQDEAMGELEASQPLKALPMPRHTALSQTRMVRSRASFSQTRKLHVHVRHTVLAHLAYFMYSLPLLSFSRQSF